MRVIDAGLFESAWPDRTGCPRHERSGPTATGPRAAFTTCAPTSSASLASASCAGLRRCPTRQAVPPLRVLVPQADVSGGRKVFVGALSVPRLLPGVRGFCTSLDRDARKLDKHCAH